MTISANHFVLPTSQHSLSTGVPAVGYKYKFYLTGTSTPASVYTASDLSGAVTSVTLNSKGMPAVDIFLDPAVNYRLVITDASDVAVHTYDNVHDDTYQAFGKLKLYNGNPNSAVAGTAGSVGGGPSDMIFDTSSNILWVCTTTGTIATAVWTNITAAISGSVSFTGTVTPSTLASSQNNYNPTDLSTASTLRLNASADSTITGLAGGSVGRQMALINTSAYYITLSHESASSTAANQFFSQTSRDVRMPPGSFVSLQYDSLTARWRIRSAPVFVPDGTYGYASNGVISTSVSGNALTIAVKTQLGADPTSGNPVFVAFRKSTLTDGNYELIAITAALSLVVPAGATLGFGNSEVNLLAVGFINNSGTAELCVTRDPVALSSDRMVSTTAIGTGSDSGTVLYSTTARSSVPSRWAASILITGGSTAGNWSNAATRVTLVNIDPLLPAKDTAKVLLHANGAGTTINDSMNVSSITDGGTGVLTVTYAVSFLSTSYQALVTTDSASNLAGPSPGSRLVGSMVVRARYGDNNVIDPDGYNVAVIGNL